ncbi:MAG: hypothetical protein JSS97_11630 [Actinobacteria bacterium]|nr:hypothetical protein [Actinomycetota bacterium]
MSQLPIHLTNNGPFSRQLARAVEAKQQTELAIFEHYLKTRYLVECTRIDSEALSEIGRTTLKEEIDDFDSGVRQAAGSAAKAELVARKTVMQSKINNALISRRFGSEGTR